MTGDLYRRPDRAAIAARIEAEQASYPGEEIMPDIGPDPEWYSELAAEADAPLSQPPVRCKACRYFTTAIGHQVACNG